LKLTDEAAPVGPSRPVTPGLLVEFQDHSLLGRAATAGVTARYERDSRLARTFFSSPRLFGLPLMSSIFLARSRQQFNSEGALPFITDKAEVTAEQRFRPRRLAELSYSYRFEKNHTFDPHRNPDDPFALDLTVNVARLNGTVLLDTRDDRLDAHHGWFHSSSLEYAVPRLGSDLRFVKYLAQQYYFRRIGPVVLASSARFGAADSFEQDLIPSEKFLAGGGNSVRGYPQDGLGEINFLGDPVGGKALLIANQEARFPIYKWIRGVGFVDAGQVFPRVRDISLGQLKAGVGFGLRVDTPVGLVRIDFGAPLSRQPGEPRGRWYFSLGQAF
jgi:outer membrane translocation and assembly module TamA